MTLRKRCVLGALGGGVHGSLGMFVYLNVDAFERMAAATDGFPRWSLWQLPLTAPEALAGAVFGLVVAVLTRSLGRRVQPADQATR